MSDCTALIHCSKWPMPVRFWDIVRWRIMLYYKYLFRSGMIKFPERVKSNDEEFTFYKVKRKQGIKICQVQIQC